MSIASVDQVPDRLRPLTTPGASPAARGSHADLVVVGGVPGAGKTTAIAAATADLPDVTVLDPDRVHRAIRARAPAWLPYRAYRLLVHTVHTVTVLAHLLLGPVPGSALVLHDPGTRRRRRHLFLGLARWRGWRIALVYVDVERAAARSGQFRRGRAQRPAAFQRHWERWQQLRVSVARTAVPGGATMDRSSEPIELLVDRIEAASVIRGLCTGSVPEPVHGPCHRAA